MKSLGWLAGILVFSTARHAFAAIDGEAAKEEALKEVKRGVQLKVEFKLDSKNKTVRAKYDSILAEDAVDWTPLGPAQNGVVLLGKINKRDKGVFQAEYMVVDSSTTPVALRQMSIVSELGRVSSIESEDETEKITVGMTAEPAPLDEITK